MPTNKKLVLVHSIVRNLGCAWGWPNVSFVELRLMLYLDTRQDCSVPVAVAMGKVRHWTLCAVLLELCLYFLYDSLHPDISSFDSFKHQSKLAKFRNCILYKAPWRKRETFPRIVWGRQRVTAGVRFHATSTQTCHEKHAFGGSPYHL